MSTEKSTIKWGKTINAQFGIEGALTYLYLLRPDSDWYEMFWGGIFYQGLYMFGPEAFRLAIGPQLGWSLLGIEAGYLATINSQGLARHGLTVRVTLTVLASGFYASYSYLFPNDGFWEVGLLVRLPIPLTVKW